MDDTTTRLSTTHHRTDDRTKSGRDDGMIDVLYRVRCTVDRWREMEITLLIINTYFSSP